MVQHLLLSQDLLHSLKRKVEEVVELIELDQENEMEEVVVNRDLLQSNLLVLQSKRIEIGEKWRWR